MSCFQVLQTLIAKMIGKTICALLKPPPTDQYSFLYIDPVAVMMINGWNITTATTIELLVNNDMQIQARYSQKLTKSHMDTRLSTHPQARSHSSASEHLDPGQVGIRDQPMTEKDRATVRPAEPKG